LKKRHVWPEGHWDWPIKVTHKHGVRSGQMLWVGGQVDLTSRGEVRNPGDLWAQIPNCMANFRRVLEDLGGKLEDLVKLLCFYVDDGSITEEEFLLSVAGALSPDARPAVTAIPVPALAYPGMLVEIEGIAMRCEDDRPLPRTYAQAPGLSPVPRPFVHGLRCGKMIFLSAQTSLDAEGRPRHPDDILAQTREVMARLDRTLRALGADFDDVVKVNRWYLGHGSVADFEPAALACAANFREPGPAATGIPLPRHAVDGVMLKIELIAMRGEDGSYLPRRHAWPESLWDWHVHLPYKHGLKCHDMIFLGGQVSLDKQGRAVHPGSLTAQTEQAMSHIGTILKELGADYGDVCKVLALYQGSSSAEDLHKNLSIRSSFFSEPGPATTGIPLPALAYPDMVIEIDTYAMADPDPA
jgi:enamine deaminase RidA (YjgF/YER057c/UK114 family)